MYIAIIADDNKKELMAQFCIAYAGILSRHSLCATYTTGRYVSEAAGLEVETLMPGAGGGVEQIASCVSYNEIDMVFYFRSTEYGHGYNESDLNLLRLCDVYNIPLATNIATAEVLVVALENGSFNWRNFINPKSEYNRKKRFR